METAEMKLLRWSCGVTKLDKPDDSMGAGCGDENGIDSVRNGPDKPDAVLCTTSNI